MKQKIIVAAALCAAILLGTIAIASDPGSVGDPLITLQWLKDTFIPQTVSKADERINAYTDPSARPENTGAEQRLKRGDAIRLESGARITPLSGTLSSTVSGAIVDLTEGNELQSGTSLSLSHCYLPAENSSGTFTVTSDTAVARLSGAYTLTLSAETDYNAMADALKAMGLFRGSDTPYGLGYDLELQPTRLQGMILFLRLLGEEQTALSYTASAVHFADVPDWALSYIAYAYDKGYTKGVGTDELGRVVFDSDSAMTAQHYVSFLLRALSYQEEVDFNWDTSVADAVSLKLFTPGEGSQVTEKPFLRAQTVYLSYYALSVPVKGSSQTLLDRLIASGAVNAQAAASAMATIRGERL